MGNSNSIIALQNDFISGKSRSPPSWFIHQQQASRNSAMNTARHLTSVGCSILNRTSSENGLKKRHNLSSLATLKRKLVRKRKRSSKSFDHAQIMKDFLSLWRLRDIVKLVDDYETMSIIRDLYLQAECARPSASTVQHDLGELYDCGYVSDVSIIYKNHQFPVHKAIVCARCPLLRELLGKVNTYGAQVTLNLDLPGVDLDVFNELLRSLYSGESQPSSAYTASTGFYDSVYHRLVEHLPNSLEHDLKHLLETGLFSDAILIFTLSPPLTTLPTLPLPVQTPSTPAIGEKSLPTMLIQPKKCRACTDQAEFPCHNVVLASRSTFFRNVILRHQKRQTWELQNCDTSEIKPFNTANQKIKIVLDESIIPRRYARIILHSIYRDSVDIVHLLPACVCKCINNLTQPNQSTSSKTSNTAQNVSTSCYLKEIMELYEIGRFLELDSLIQSCEDMLIDSLSIETLVNILNWSEQPHGSPWVKRQALVFLREEFSAVASSPILFQLDLQQLKEATKSDFLQASELEIFQAVIKWGENRLIKRMEEREPNLISQTTHSLRHNLRKRDLNDDELRDIISELTPFIRVGHILPHDNEAYVCAMKRGLIRTLPPYMMAEDSVYSQLPLSVSRWLPARTSPTYLRPRYFIPYVEEAKLYLQSRLARHNEQIASTSMKNSAQSIPDTLYMIKKSSMSNLEDFPDFLDSYAANSLVGGFNCCGRESSTLAQLSMIEPRILLLMKQRVQELIRSLITARCVGSAIDKQEILKYIQMRVVREFGLPDMSIEMNCGGYHGANDIDSSDQYEIVGVASDSGSVSSSIVSGGSVATPPSPMPTTTSMVAGGSTAASLIGLGLEELDSKNTRRPYLVDASGYGYINHGAELTRDLTPLRNDPYGYTYSKESIDRQGRLFDAMPDIALATSALAELNLLKNTESPYKKRHSSSPKLDSRRGALNHDWKT